MKLKEFLPALLVLILVLGLCTTAICYASYERQTMLTDKEPVSFAPPICEWSDTEDVFKVSAKVETPTINETTEASTENPVSESEPETTSAGSSEETTAYVPPEDDSRIYYTNYHFTTVDASYFDDAVFIGNSRMQGFILYCGIPELTSYTSVGMTVKSYFTKEDFMVNGVSMTAAQALENTSDYNKVYLKLGINELGWVSTEQFITAYSEIMEHIYTCNPDAIIYVISVLPFAETAIEKDPVLDMNKVREYNDAIQGMCASYGACYLDVSSVFTGEDGYMPYDYSFDGVHINVASIQLWLNYLLEHAIEK